VSPLSLDLGFRLGEWSAARPGYFVPWGKIPCCHSKRKPGWFQIWTGRFEDDVFFPASQLKHDSWFVQHVA
jgi:hypothetical protein